MARAPRSSLRLLRPTSGRVFFDQRDITAVPESGLRWFRHRAQAIFQDPFSSLDPRVRVGDSIAEPDESYFVNITGVTGGSRVTFATGLAAYEAGKAKDQDKVLEAASVEEPTWSSKPRVSRSRRWRPPTSWPGAVD